MCRGGEIVSDAEEIGELVSAFGADVKSKLSGPGQAEANLRRPLENLLVGAAAVIGKKATFFDEVSDQVRGVRPDYAFKVDGAITGYVEVKAPGRQLDPSSLAGHDLKQWERQRDLPNLLYTNGTEFRLYRDGELLLDPVLLPGGPLEAVGAKLKSTNEFQLLLSHLFQWKPAPITSVTKLVNAVAPLTRLLREAVLEQLEIEATLGIAEAEQPFSGLARDWRSLLFPDASDEKFADGYAQTVTFALLLARVEEIDLTQVSMHEVGKKLGSRHSLMGRALQLLTDQVVGEFQVTLDLLSRVVGALDWKAVQKGSRDAYLHLYEKFLAVYDPELRKQSGSYYTPVEVVDEMVRLAEEALQTRLGIEAGFIDDRVLTVDPAMGTGTYLQSIIESSKKRIEAESGSGAVGPELSSLAARLVGFEIQTGPFAVAELRLSELLSDEEATLPEGGMKLFVADTLDDPYAPERTVASTLQAISASRKAASKIKRDANVTVVIGNPPYGERAEGLGGWIESGSAADAKKGREAPLDAFRAEGNGRHENALKNLYAYFWRWGTWKAFDSTPDDRSGVVCFITTNGFLLGHGFKGMREYLRRTCSEGWVINVSPEGIRPPINTRFFPGVQQTLAIGIFVRSDRTSNDEPAEIYYRELAGRRAEKYEALAKVALNDDGWRVARTNWQAPFSPAASSNWDEFPSLELGITTWALPGNTGNRAWPYAPSRDLLLERWQAFITETDESRKRVLLKETGDRYLEKVVKPLEGFSKKPPLKDEEKLNPDIVQVGYRSLDRQWVIADSRVLDRPRRELWAARIEGQVFAICQNSKAIESGPGVMFTTLIPDVNHFNNRGGRVMPMLHPDGSPNLSPGLAEALGIENPRDLFPYIAGVASHPGYTEHFADELATPGIRIPITKDPELFAKAVRLGKRVIWLHSFGEMTDFQPEGEEFEYPVEDPKRPKMVTPMKGLPEATEEHDSETNTLTIGTAQFTPVSEEAAAYAVGGRKVIHSWLGYRKKEPIGTYQSPLDQIVTTEWPKEWTKEFLELLTVLSKLVEQEAEQAELLTRILESDLYSVDELTAAGVIWPTERASQKPRYPAPDESELFGSLEG